MDISIGFATNVSTCKIYSKQSTICLLKEIVVMRKVINRVMGTITQRSHARNSWVAYLRWIN